MKGLSFEEREVLNYYQKRKRVRQGDLEIVNKLCQKGLINVYVGYDDLYAWDSSYSKWFRDQVYFESRKERWRILYQGQIKDVCIFYIYQRIS